MLPFGKVTFACQGISKNQDFVDVFMHDDKTYLVCMDGHGNSRTIDQFRNGDIDFKEIISTNFDNSPEEELQVAIDALNAADLADPNLTLAARYMLRGMIETSGSTISIVRIDECGVGEGGEGGEGEIVCRSCGDSGIVVVRNGKIVYRSPDHTYENDREKLRLTGELNKWTGESTKLGSPIKQRGKPYLLSSTDITMKPNYAFRFTGIAHTRLVPTQSLGHCGLTGLDPAVCRITFTREDKVRVLVATDGLWDMIVPESMDYVAADADAADADEDDATAADVDVIIDALVDVGLEQEDDIAAAAATPDEEEKEEKEEEEEEKEEEARDETRNNHAPTTIFNITHADAAEATMMTPKNAFLETALSDRRLVCHGSVEELMECAIHRWKQTWNFFPDWIHDPRTFERVAIPDVDDIACILFET